MDLFDWFEKKFKPKVCNSVEFMYDEMNSQSNQSLPIIYRPFDPSNRLHWCDRGYIFDYLFAIEGEGKLLMDFGPGDGWPSLLIAPYVDRVIGVEGSWRRAEVCRDNARHLGISNATFIYVKPGTSLPFEDNSIDCIAAAHSVEQTPAPKTTLREFYRILKPDGHLRIGYEALSRYRNGREHEVYFDKISDRKCRFVIYDRNIYEERVKMLSFTVVMSPEEISSLIKADVNAISVAQITKPFLERIESVLTDPRVCTLFHPSGITLVSWLKEIGFRYVIPTHSGGKFAGQLFDQLSDRNRISDIDEVDRLLKPLIKIVVKMVAPIEIDPMITAIK